MSDISANKSEPLPVGTAPPSSARPVLPDSSILDSLTRVLLGDSKQTMDLPRALQSESKRLQAITRVVNAFQYYLATVAGRPSDEMTASDVARLGMILKILDEVEVSDRVRRLS